MVRCFGAEDVVDVSPCSFSSFPPIPLNSCLYTLVYLPPTTRLNLPPLPTLLPYIYFFPPSCLLHPLPTPSALRCFFPRVFCTEDKAVTPSVYEQHTMD